MKILRKIFSVYNESYHKVVCILGIKIKFTSMSRIKNELKGLIYKQPHINRKLITTAFLHQKTFAGYRGIHFGKDVILFGAGPSLQYFEPGGGGTLNVAVNRAFLFDKVHMDYIFSIDSRGMKDFYEELINYPADSSKKTVKFLGDQNLGAGLQIPEDVIHRANGLRYKTTAGILPNRFTYDIETEPLGNFCTVSLQAMQFILYTNPKRIFLAGIDCNVATGGHFCGTEYDFSRNKEIAKHDRLSVDYWKQLKRFAETYYPNTEIISINPVGLRGIFKDVYTHSFVEAHPDIFENGVEIEYLN